MGEAAKAPQAELHFLLTIPIKASIFSEQLVKPLSSSFAWKFALLLVGPA